MCAARAVCSQIMSDNNDFTRLCRSVTASRGFNLCAEAQDLGQVDLAFFPRGTAIGISFPAVTKET